MDETELLQNLRADVLELFKSRSIPVPEYYLATVLGTLHITTQLLDVIYADRRDAPVETAIGSQPIGEILHLANTLLNVAAEKLDFLPGDEK